MTFLKSIFYDVNHLNFYLTLTVVLTAFALICLFTALFNLRKIKRIALIQPLEKPPAVLTSHDIRAIAGDDVMSTQLDLARAYMEMSKNNLAKKILTHVLKNGDSQQKTEANELITELEH